MYAIRSYYDDQPDSTGRFGEFGGVYIPVILAHPVAGVPPVARPAAAFGRMRERSAGKDT